MKLAVSESVEPVLELLSPPLLDDPKPPLLDDPKPPLLDDPSMRPPEVGSPVLELPPVLVLDAGPSSSTGGSVMVGLTVGSGTVGSGNVSLDCSVVLVGPPSSSSDCSITIGSGVQASAAGNVRSKVLRRSRLRPICPQG